MERPRLRRARTDELAQGRASPRQSFPGFPKTPSPASGSLTVAGEIVKAFISLKPGFEADKPLARELLGHAR